MVDSSDTVRPLLRASPRIFQVYQDGAKQAIARAGYSAFENYTILADACVSTDVRAYGVCKDLDGHWCVDHKYHPEVLDDSWPFDNAQRYEGR